MSLLHPIIFSKILILISDPTFTKADIELKQALFGEGDNFFSLIKEYAISYHKNQGENLSLEIPLKIQELYMRDAKVKKFLDNLQIVNY